MIKLGALNSRMKDFYDIWLLSRQFEFDGTELVEAIRLTLENRGTEIPEVITSFTNEFINDKEKQWAAFHKRIGLEHVPADFAEVVVSVDAFLQPIASALYATEEFKQKWSFSDSWT